MKITEPLWQTKFVIGWIDMRNNRRSNPYLGLPRYQFWKNEIGATEPSQFDPVVQPAFKLQKNTKIVTAGSCFAQHLARRLSEAGFNHLVTENAHPLVSKDVATRHNYGVFSARYGNIYNSLQFLQLVERAIGQVKTPTGFAWKSNAENCYLDPFRPQIQPGGYVSIQEMEADREAHLSATLEAISNAELFVFTLGLTEAWVHRQTGFVLPLAPGVVGGKYEESEFEFKNFTLEETVDSLRGAIRLIRSVNPEVEFLVTVSPVPLNATYENRHVFVSTTISKSVLRLAAEYVCNSEDRCSYFPSYEIITSPFSRGAYYMSDCRQVADIGVDHVMRVFFDNYTTENPSLAVNASDDRVLVDRVQQSHAIEMQKAINILCDEESISDGRK